MTDDMLRKECADLSFELPGMYLGKDIDKLMHFARRMQAVGLREAKIEIDRLNRYYEIALYSYADEDVHAAYANLSAWCEAEATKRGAE